MNFILRNMQRYNCFLFYGHVWLCLYTSIFHLFIPLSWCILICFWPLLIFRVSMVIYTLFVFHPKGPCLFHKDWRNPETTSGDINLTDDQYKLTFGLLHNLKTICSRLQPVDTPSSNFQYSQPPYLQPPPGAAPSQLSRASTGVGSGNFVTFATDKYRLHVFETPTGLRICCTTEPTCAPQRELLYQV